MAVGTRCANHVTPLYPQKMALTSPTGGGRSVSMVRSRTKATEFSLVFLVYMHSMKASRCVHTGPYFITVINDSQELHVKRITQGVPGGMCQTSGECSLGQTIPI